MSEPESNFMKQVKIWGFTSLATIFVMALIFYGTTMARLNYLEQNDKELRDQHNRDMSLINQRLASIDQTTKDILLKK